MDSQDAARLPLEVAVQTHRGNVREVNEDDALVGWWPDGSALLVVVADGMGGHSGGEVASHIAVEVFREMLLRPLPSERRETYEALLERFYAADAAIRGVAADDPSLLGMGTTLVAAIVTQSEFIHLHAGDCRVYHFGPGDQTYVTVDHSVIQVLLDTGHIAQDEIAQHPMRSVVTSCLGGGADAEFCVDPKWDVGSSGGPAFRPLSQGDVLLLSSDGFHSQIDESAPARLAMELRDDTDMLAKEAVSTALEAGGNDNITVIAIRWNGYGGCLQTDESPLTTGKLIPDEPASRDYVGGSIECTCSSIQPEQMDQDQANPLPESEKLTPASETAEPGDTQTRPRSLWGRLLCKKSK